MIDAPPAPQAAPVNSPDEVLTSPPKKYPVESFLVGFVVVVAGVILGGIIGLIFSLSRGWIEMSC